jgi:peroxiredoxin-like protein
MHQYKVDLRWLSDRKGIISSPELDTEIEVATPPQFPKGMDNIWSPEHFFTAAVVSCFMTTFLAVAENSKLAFTDFSCASEGKLEQIEGKYLMTEVILRPSLKLVDEADREKAERILQKSEKACLITNSIKAVVTLETTVTV